MSGIHVIDDFHTGGRRIYTHDWSRFLAEGDTIASAAAFVETPDGDLTPLDLDPATGSNATHDTTTTTVEFFGGTAGVRYPLTVTITTTAGETHPDQLVVDVQP